MKGLNPMAALVMSALANRQGGNGAPPPVMPGGPGLGAPTPPMPNVPSGLPAGLPPPGVPKPPGGLPPGIPSPGMSPTDLPPIPAGGPPLMSGPGAPPMDNTPPVPAHQPWEIQDQGNGTAVIRAKGPGGQPGPVVKVIKIKRQENDLHQQQLKQAQ